MRWSTVLLCGLLIAGGCSVSEGPERVEAGERPANEEWKYVALESDEWDLRDTGTAGSNTASAVVEPSLEWFAEYERLVPTEGGRESQDLRLSRHAAALDEHAEELPGANLTEGQIEGRPARWGVGPDGTPAVVTIQSDARHTVMLLSYALAVDELRDVVRWLRPVTEDAWDGQRPSDQAN